MSTELVEEELKPYLDTVLTVAIERSESMHTYILIDTYYRVIRTPMHAGYYQGTIFTFQRRVLWM